MADRPLNFSTRIPAKRTAQECLSLLAEAGADAVAAQYMAKQPVGLSFRLTTPGGKRDFAMPINVDGVHKMLQRADLGSRSGPQWRSRDHALNVAWRVVKDWLEAQLAIIAAEVVTLDEVMLPYLQVGDGRTLYQEFAASGLAGALEAGHG